MKYCKNCGSDSTVYDTRLKSGAVVRRRKCQKCGRKWMTIEVEYWQYKREHQEEGDESAELF